MVLRFIFQSQTQAGGIELCSSNEVRNEHSSFSFNTS